MTYQRRTKLLVRTTIDSSTEEVQIGHAGTKNVEQQATSLIFKQIAVVIAAFPQPVQLVHLGI